MPGSNRVSRARRDGLTLLEVLVALTILGIASASWAALARESELAVETARAREREVSQAANELARLSLLSADELAAISARRSGRLVVTVRREDNSIFAVTVTDSASGALLLETAFYRRDSPPLP